MAESTAGIHFFPTRGQTDADGGSARPSPPSPACTPAGKSMKIAGD